VVKNVFENPWKSVGFSGPKMTRNYEQILSITKNTKNLSIWRKKKFIAVRY